MTEQQQRQCSIKTSAQVDQENRRVVGILAFCRRCGRTKGKQVIFDFEPTESTISNSSLKVSRLLSKSCQNQNSD